MNDLQTFANGDTTYVPKLNNNFSSVKSAVDALELNVAAQIGAAFTGGQAFSALFGTNVALVGALSCVCTGSGVTLSIDAGYYWNPASTTVVRRLVSSNIDFTALAAATYYVLISDTRCIDINLICEWHLLGRVDRNGFWNYHTDGGTGFWCGG